MKSNKLEVKDLILVGIFTAVYFAVLFACGMLAYIPILYVLLPVIAPIITGIPFILFLTKTKKFGMVTIMGSVLGFVQFAMGHTYIVAVFGVVFGFLADLVFKAGGYKKTVTSILGYGIFSIWILGNILPLWLLRDEFLVTNFSSLGSEYTAAIIRLTPTWVAFAMVAAAFISGIIGAFLGKAALKKHFIKAGIV